MLLILLSFALLPLIGCAGSQPLSITLYHPETRAVQTCSARQAVTGDSPGLAAAVETCAQALEAHGFVRGDLPLP